jgi:hypothetical protein
MTVVATTAGSSWGEGLHKPCQPFSSENQASSVFNQVSFAIFLGREIIELGRENFFLGSGNIFLVMKIIFPIRKIFGNGRENIYLGGKNSG